MTDETLIATGNLDELRTRYQDKLTSYAAKRLDGDQSAAATVVATFFRRLAKHAAKFDTSRRFQPWAYTIVDHLATVARPAKYTIKANGRTLLKTNDLREVETVAATMTFAQEIQEFDVEGTAAELEEHFGDWADGPVDFALAAAILVPA